MYDFYQNNKAYCISFIIICLVCAAGIWLVHDAGRNERLQNDTDSILVNINQGIADAEGRIESATGSISQAEQAVHGAAERIEKSERAAAEITDGIRECQDIVERCIQRSGRIQNIISDIEAANRQRTAGTSSAGMAK